MRKLDRSSAANSHAGRNSLDYRSLGSADKRACSFFIIINNLMELIITLVAGLVVAGVGVFLIMRHPLCKSICHGVVFGLFFLLVLEFGGPKIKLLVVRLGVW